LRYQDCLGKDVQPVQVNVRQNRGNHTALRRSAERGPPYPVFQVSGLKHVAHQPEEPVIMDLLRENPDHNIVVKTPETIGDVTLDEPGCPGPGLGHIPQGGVASPAGTETIGAAGELRLVVRLKQQANYLADQLIRPGRHAERTEFPVLLRDIDPPHRAEPVALVAQRINDAPYLFHRHAVRGFPGDPRRHRPLVGVDAPIGQQIQLRAEQKPVQPFQRQAAPAALTEDTQHCLGIPHLAYLPVSNVRSPGPLRPASGFPGLPGGTLLPRLLRGLRHHRTRAP
jgi:hypothetical protein